MSTTVLNGLRDYLYGTLSPANMLWLAEQLRQYVLELQQQKPYTIEEVNAIIDESELQLAEGKYKSHEEVFKELYEAETI